MLSVVTRSIMLNVVMLSVVVPAKLRQFERTLTRDSRPGFRRPELEPDRNAQGQGQQGQLEGRTGAKAVSLFFFRQNVSIK
jgi:hypothetical protein